MRSRTGLPLTSTRSPNEMRWPVCAGSPLTVILPSAISSSMSRREPMPACASTLCSLGASGSGGEHALARFIGLAFGLRHLGDRSSNSPDSTCANTSPASTGATGCRWRGNGPSKLGGSVQRAQRPRIVVAIAAVAAVAPVAAPAPFAVGASPPAAPAAAGLPSPSPSALPVGAGVRSRARESGARVPGRSRRRCRRSDGSGAA